MKTADGKSVIVQPPCGAIKGILEISSLGYEYANFYDIPYAKPPLGPLRFKVRTNAELTLIINNGIFILYLLYDCELYCS